MFERNNFKNVFKIVRRFFGKKLPFEELMARSENQDRIFQQIREAGIHPAALFPRIVFADRAEVAYAYAVMQYIEGRRHGLLVLANHNVVMGHDFRAADYAAEPMLRIVLNENFLPELLPFGVLANNHMRNAFRGYTPEPFPHAPLAVYNAAYHAYGRGGRIPAFEAVQQIEAARRAAVFNYMLVDINYYNLRYPQIIQLANYMAGRFVNNLALNLVELKALLILFAINRELVTVIIQPWLLYFLGIEFYLSFFDVLWVSPHQLLTLAYQIRLEALQMVGGLDVRVFVNQDRAYNAAFYTFCTAGTIGAFYALVPLCYRLVLQLPALVAFYIPGAAFFLREAVTLILFPEGVPQWRDALAAIVELIQTPASFVRDILARLFLQPVVPRLPDIAAPLVDQQGINVPERSRLKLKILRKLLRIIFRGRL